MGLIRKTLMISTGGLVRGSSKKQRVAKKSLRELRTQTKLQQQQVRAQQAASSAVPQPPAPSGPPAGWYPSPTQQGATQWWDGVRWTEHFKPAS